MNVDWADKFTKHIKGIVKYQCDLTIQWNQKQNLKCVNKYVMQFLNTSQVKNTSFGGIQVNSEAPQQRKQSFLTTCIHSDCCLVDFQV